MADITAATLSLKRRLDIKETDTDHDPLLRDFVENAVKRLYPRVGEEANPENVDVTVDDYGEASVNLKDISVAFARRVEGYDGQTWVKITDTLHHGQFLRLRGLNSNISTVKIYGIKKFSGVDDVYDEFYQAVLWYAMGEFYDFAASDKKLYNIYAQQMAARGVESMQDVSAYYVQMADNYLEEQRQVYA